MMANRSKRGGSFLIMSPDKPQADVSLLDSYIQAQVQSHMFGRDIPPWMSQGENNELDVGMKAVDPLASGIRQDQDQDGGVDSTSPTGRGKISARRRRGINIPVPGDLEGAEICPFLISIHSSHRRDTGKIRMAPWDHGPRVLCCDCMRPFIRRSQVLEHGRCQPSRRQPSKGDGGQNKSRNSAEMMLRFTSSGILTTSTPAQWTQGEG